MKKCICDEPGESTCELHVRENELQDRAILAENLLAALLGDNWRDLTIRDVQEIQQKRDGQQLHVLHTLSEIAQNHFGGRSRFDVTVFGDGTIEVSHIAVRETIDEEYGKQKILIRVPLPPKCYRITDNDLKEMLYDFDNCEWMESEDQTSQGVRKEIEDLKAKMVKLANLEEKLKESDPYKEILDLKQRLRNISQQIIAKIGAEGPENAEESVKRLLEKMEDLIEDNEILKTLVKDLAEHMSKVAPDSSWWIENLAPRVDQI